MKKDNLLFRICCAMFGISAFSILLSFFGDYNGNQSAVFFAVMTGVLFWGGLILGVVLLFILNNHRKKNKHFRDVGRTGNQRFGALSFFSNKTAAVFDIAMVVLLILVVISMFIPLMNQGITLALFAFFLFSVYMHSLFNGVNFTYINSLNEECRE